jgi:hypothetical protein
MHYHSWEAIAMRLQNALNYLLIFHGGGALIVHHHIEPLRPVFFFIDEIEVLVVSARVV